MGDQGAVRGRCLRDAGEKLSIRVLANVHVEERLSTSRSQHSLEVAELGGACGLAGLRLKLERHLDGTLQSRPRLKSTGVALQYVA